MKPLLWAAIVSALAASVLAGEASSDPRRTPAVEVFPRNKDAVIYLTGPMAGKDGLPVEEFFRLPHRREVNNLGSGFVIHPSGYILTNAHAVESPIYHEVIFSAGRKLPAELLAVVREHDLALLKVESQQPLAAVRLARAGDLMVGEPVIVIGNPEGLLLTCTTGVVSAVGRSTKPSGLPGIVLQGLLQTDAAINPGSSGGPWFNALGEVIGITTSVKQGSENIGFGVSVEAIRNVLPDMLDVERRQGIIAGLELKPGEPCRVSTVEADSPAAAAGVQSNDVIEKLDGTPLAGKLEYGFALIGRRPGDVLKLDLLRDGKPVAVSLVLAPRPKPDGAALLKTLFGITAVPLDREKAEATSLRVQRGVVIADVAKGPPWDYEKLQSPPLAGDVLARIDSIRPRDLEHVGLLLDRIPPGKTVKMVLLRRNGDTVTRVDLTTIAPPRKEPPQRESKP